jgi:proline racemase
MSHPEPLLPTAYLTAWRPPDNWWRIETIDAHTAGEPFRVVLTGYPEPRGATMLERRRYLAEHYDHLRRAIMLEPRGHADMYGCVVTHPATSDGHLGVLFLHNEGYSTMCGHGIIGLASVLAETGFFGAGPIPDPLRIDSPAGRIEARIEFDGERAKSVSFRNVPSFLYERDVSVEVKGIGTVTCDLAYGGAFYAYVDASSVCLSCRPDDVQRLIDAGRRIKQAIIADRPIHHPEADDLGFLYGVIFTGPAESAGHHSRHVCIFADGEVDRSPTGTGVSGRLAILHARAELATNETIVIESILGGTFNGSVVDTCLVDGYAAVVPEVSGRAFITGRHQFLIDPSDPYRAGFMLR